MNWVRENKGDAKADWLWNRIGILCVRTVLSIMPTLSREYDQHFRSFNGIPWSFPSSSGAGAYGTGGAAADKGGKEDRPRSGSRGKAGQSRSRSRGPASADRARAATADQQEEDNEDAEEEDDEEEEDENGAVNQKKGNNWGRNPGADGVDRGRSSTGAKSKPAGDDPGKMPGTRGSRCFEILGFDIMIDSKLRPWLIEVNHLPSFGTDSPLDLDIKARLMAQVRDVSPVRSDAAPQLLYSYRVRLLTFLSVVLVPPR